MKKRSSLIGGLIPLLSLFLPVPNMIAETIEVAPQVQIYYESAGQGVPLLFVPGWTMTVGVWREQVAFFSKTNRVITMDPRSHGNSSKVLGGNSLGQHARDLRKLVDSLQLKKVVLVAWGTGVGTALEYINQFGNDPLAALVLVDGGPGQLKREDGPPGLSQEEIYRVVMNCENQRVEHTDRFVDSLFKTNRPESELEWLAKESFRTPTTVASLLLYDSIAGDRRPYLARVSVPTLVISTTENKEIGEYMKSHIAGARHLVFEGTGHGLFMEDPGKFNETLNGFLKALD
jgi:non-heme chloroperoxidase